MMVYFSPRPRHGIIVHWLLSRHVISRSPHAASVLSRSPRSYVDKMLILIEHENSHISSHRHPRVVSNDLDRAFSHHQMHTSPLFIIVIFVCRRCHHFLEYIKSAHMILLAKHSKLDEYLPARRAKMQCGAERSHSFRLVTNRAYQPASPGQLIVALITIRRNGSKMLIDYITYQSISLLCHH